MVGFLSSLPPLKTLTPHPHPAPCHAATPNASTVRALHQTGHHKRDYCLEGSRVCGHSNLKVSQGGVALAAGGGAVAPWHTDNSGSIAADCLRFFEFAFPR
ncbi:hypothetical protein J6590_074202 [Homalodisca vitripennis]|nr:hypothetical protein J6590_074202 [Homalodisca vitripennis]